MPESLAKECSYQPASEASGDWRIFYHHDEEQSVRFARYIDFSIGEVPILQNHIWILNGGCNFGFPTGEFWMTLVDL